MTPLAVSVADMEPGRKFRAQYLEMLAFCLVDRQINYLSYVARRAWANKHLRSKYMPHQGKKERGKHRD